MLTHLIGHGGQAPLPPLNPPLDEIIMSETSWLKVTPTVRVVHCILILHTTIRKLIFSVETLK